MIRNLLIAAAAVAFAPAGAFAQTVAYNSTPTDTWYFGNSNDYSPANTTVLTTAGSDQLYLRWHVRGLAAPSAPTGVYSFTSDQFSLPTFSLSFDWGFDEVNALSDVTSALITVDNLTTGASVSYNPLAAGNDNELQDGSTQNSARLSFPFLFGSGFNPAVDGYYRVNLEVQGLTGGTQSLSVDAVIEDNAVPEPATWAMMLAGFGLVGATLRRRSGSLATA